MLQNAQPRATPHATTAERRAIFLASVLLTKQRNHAIVAARPVTSAVSATRSLPPVQVCLLVEVVVRNATSAVPGVTSPVTARRVVPMVVVEAATNEVDMEAEVVMVAHVRQLATHVEALAI